MKKVSIFSIIALMAILILSYGCKKEEDKVLNVISVAGNTEATYNNDYIPNGALYSGPFDADCNTTLYRSDIYITFETDAQLGITFFHPTNSTTIINSMLFKFVFTKNRIFQDSGTDFYIKII